MTSPEWIQVALAGIAGVFSGIAVTYGMVKRKVEEATATVKQYVTDGNKTVGEFCDRVTAVEKQGNKMFTKISVLESELKNARADIDKAEEDRHTHP